MIDDPRPLSPPAAAPAQSALPLVIAIDGPAASGKSTVGEAVAQRLGFLYFDTGAMYRAVTLVALNRATPIADEGAVSALAAQVHIDILPPTAADGRQYTVLADNEDVTWAIRSPEVDANVSAVSSYPGVRAAMTQQQRRVAGGGRVVMVGRDIGTVVVPEAPLKIYLDASLEVRARRRYEEQLARGEYAQYAITLAAMRARDAYDSSRDAAPLRAAAAAIIINTDALDVAAVTAMVLCLAGQELGVVVTP